MTKLIRLLLVLISVAAAATHATTARPRPKRLPPLDEVRVFTSVDYPTLRVLYGRTKKPGRACRPYVIEIGRAGVHVPKIEGTVTNEDGVSLVFHDGRRLVMPHDGSAGSIWHLARHRELLTETTFDEKLMSELSTRVTFGRGTEPAAVFPELERIRAGEKVYQITIHDAARAAELDHEGPPLLAQQRLGSTVEWWAFGAEADQIEARARTLNIAITRVDTLDPNRLPAFPSGIKHDPPAARDVWRYVIELERLLRKSIDIEWSIRYLADHDRALTWYREHFKRPLQERVAAAYAALRAYDSDLGLELYLWTGGSVGPRVSQLDWAAGSERGTFFAEWLNLLDLRVGWTSRVANVTANVSTISGFFTPNFPDVRLDFVDFQHPNSPAYLHDETPTYPLRLFGLRNSARARHALIDFIMNGDKQAEWQRRVLETDPDQTPSTGSKTLARVIRALPFGPNNHRDDPGFPAVKFRPALYYTQVAQILTELLDTSAVSLINFATYLTTVDAALTLQTEIQREFGLNPSAGGHSLERDRLTHELFRLQQATQKQTMRMCALHLLNGAS